MPIKFSSNDNKHFSLLGFTALTVDPVACCVIFSGIENNSRVEAILDFAKYFAGDFADKYFFEKTLELEGRSYGAYLRTHRKKITCFTRWSEKGSMTSMTLADALREMDEQWIFDRSAWIKRLMLPDGHSSRSDLELTQHASIPPHEWAACVGAS